MAIRALPALGWRPLRWAVIATLAICNAVLILPLLDQLFTDSYRGFDYDVLSRASQLANPYVEPWYVWSPVAVYPLKLLPIIGEAGWWAMHVLWLVPFGWPLGLLVGLSWPFVYDLVSGNVMPLIAVLGWLALSGNRYAASGFMVMALLIPRPLMVPLVAWLLRREPWSRRWFAGLFIAHAAAVIATGLGPAWIDRLLHLPGVMENPGNLVGWLGWAWWPIGLAIAAVAFRYGRIGIASVAIQPYIWTPYLLPLVWELRRQRGLHDLEDNRRNRCGGAEGARPTIHPPDHFDGMARGR